MTQSRRFQDVCDDERRLHVCKLFLWYLRPKDVLPPSANTKNRTPFWVRESSLHGLETLAEQLRHLKTDEVDRECFEVTKIIMLTMKHLAVGSDSEALVSILADKGL
jgi:hypothetical protein